MKVTRMLEAEARRRRLWPPPATEQDSNVLVDIPGAFMLVRDMPYARASDRRPQTIIREWRGTCSGKHYLLQAVLAEFGYDSQLMVCTHYIPQELGRRLPPELAALFDEGPVPDVHTYLVLKTPDGPMTIDATWPLQTRPFGTIVNERFQWGEDMQIACNPLDHIPVPSGMDPQAFKEQLLIERFSPKDLERRETLIQGLGALAEKASKR